MTTTMATGGQLTLDFLFEETTPKETTKTAAPEAKPEPESKTRRGKGELLYSRGTVEVIEEALRAEEHGGVVVRQRVEGGRYEVAGSKGIGYEVRVRGGRAVSCTCPDATRGRAKEPCKHQHAVIAHIRHTDARSLHEHELRRFGGMLAGETKPPRGLSLSFAERAFLSSKEKLEAMGEPRATRRQATATVAATASATATEGGHEEPEADGEERDIFGMTAEERMEIFG